MALSIKLSQRAYGGKKFRPPVTVDFEEANNMLLCVTPWGQPGIANKVIESVKGFITMAHEDSELTVPYARKENLQQMGNVLRMAVIMASEKIFNEFNKDEYSSGFEIFAAIQEGPQWTYVSCGQPSLVLNREHMGTIPLSHSIDLNVLALKNRVQDPLPNQLLGLGQNPPIHYGNIYLKKSDRLALISRTYLPHQFFELTLDQFNAEQIASTLANDQQEVPFWLGFINLD
jgi:hypothetical protein